MQKWLLNASKYLQILANCANRKYKNMKLKQIRLQRLEKISSSSENRKSARKVSEVLRTESAILLTTRKAHANDHANRPLSLEQ